MAYFRSKLELEQDLQDQLHLLRKRVKEFDSGDLLEAKDISARLRTILYDGTNKSLLTLLGLTGIGFLNTSIHGKTPVGFVPQSGLAGLCITEDAVSYYSWLDEMPFGVPVKTFYYEWWTETVFSSADGSICVSRKDCVSGLANKDGGAHVAEEIQGIYAKFTRENLLGWKTRVGALKGVELAAVRQIAHEVLKTFDEDYSAMPVLPEGGMFIAGLSLEKVDTVPSHTPGKNVKCPCGSGKKYRKCCKQSEPL